MVLRRLPLNRFLETTSPQSSRQCVGLLDVRPEFRSQVIYQNESRVLRRLPLSRFLAKTLRVNKKCHEKLLKKICCQQSILNWDLHHCPTLTASYEITRKMRYLLECQTTKKNSCLLQGTNQFVIFLASFLKIAAVTKNYRRKVIKTSKLEF